MVSARMPSSFIIHNLVSGLMTFTQFRSDTQSRVHSDKWKHINLQLARYIQKTSKHWENKATEAPMQIALVCKLCFQHWHKCSAESYSSPSFHSPSFYPFFVKPQLIYSTAWNDNNQATGKTLRPHCWFIAGMKESIHKHTHKKKHMQG